jgi:fructose-specific component phosphotransferase system IIB-like protein
VLYYEATLPPKFSLVKRFVVIVMRSKSFSSPERGLSQAAAETNANHLPISQQNAKRDAAFFIRQRKPTPCHPSP